MKYLMTLAIVLFAAHLSFAQNDVIKSDSLSVEVSKGMVLIPGGNFEMGIAEEELKELVEMGHSDY